MTSIVTTWILITQILAPFAPAPPAGPPGPAASPAISETSQAKPEEGLDPAPVRAFPSVTTQAIVPGVARPHRFATLAAPSEGMLATIFVEPGRHVEQGEAIAQMDDRVLRAAEQAARAIAEHDAALSRARYTLDMRRRIAQRSEEGHASGGVHLSELEDAQSQLAIAETDLRLELERARDARLAHRLAQERLDALTVRAPFSGVIARVIAREGETLPLGEPIATIAQLDHLRVEIDLPASWLLALEPGARYPLIAEAPISRILPALLVHVEPMLDPATASVRCVFAIDNRAVRLPAGFTVLPHTGELGGADYERASGDATPPSPARGQSQPPTRWLALPGAPTDSATGG